MDSDLSDNKKDRASQVTITLNASAEDWKAGTDLYERPYVLRRFMTREHVLPILILESPLKTDGFSAFKPRSLFIQIIFLKIKLDFLRLTSLNQDVFPSFLL